MNKHTHACIKVCHNQIVMAFTGSLKECSDSAFELSENGQMIEIVKIADLHDSWYDGDISLSSESEDILIDWKNA